MTHSIIKGTGTYLPPRVVTNDDLAGWMETSDEWIRQRTGIEERRWVPEQGGVGASDLALEASRVAMDRCGWTPDSIDLIIFATLSPDIFFPGSGCLLQNKLGLTTTPALDIRQQCTGFLYGLVTADAYIKSGYARRILLAGAEVHSTGLDLSTRGRDTAAIFGDGAGVVCLEGAEIDDGAGILGAALHADGGMAESLMLEGPASREWPRIDEKMLAEGRHYPHMDGQKIFKTAVRLLPKVAGEALEQAGISQEAVDLFIPHQANLRINQAFARAMNLPDEKVFHNIQKYGNTTAASIPIALDEALAQGRLGPGSTAMFLGLGSGLTWGAVLYRFPG
jgi:3-oxoacyl-[acyl-carrier-protein] synthase-3